MARRKKTSEGATAPKAPKGLVNGKAVLLKDISYNRKKGDEIQVSESTYQNLYKKGIVE